jgi:o-succinylbenzoate synthase
MKLKTSIEHRVLHFKKPAGTSRGVYRTHDVWYVRLWSDDLPFCGIGECAPLPDLSWESCPYYFDRLQLACRRLEEQGFLDVESLRAYPSILFGLETAYRSWQQQSNILWDSAFTRGKSGIPINGLIWMGSKEAMLKELSAKLDKGFTCLKLKIGALDFEEELALLKSIRSRFSATELVLRVDANGAFLPEEALERLSRLSELELHSIEQPISARQMDDMAALIADSPLPIALDEELIGVRSFEEKKSLLQTLKPAYLVLKPTLHGGIMGCSEWMELAESMHIGWWITSALESNVGLNAVAQWTATLPYNAHQGLGTGLLYTNNIESPLKIRGEYLWFDLDKSKRLHTFVKPQL